MKSYVFPLLMIAGMTFIAAGQEQWVQTNMPGGGIIGSIAAIDADLFASTPAGIFRTSNKGAYWNAYNSDQRLNTNSLLFSIGSVLFALTGDAIYRSTDKASTWVFVNTQTSCFPYNIYSFISIDSTIYCAADYLTGDISDHVLHNGIFCITGSGANWHRIDSPPYNSVYNAEGNFDIEALAVIGGTIFSGTRAGVYLSADTCKSWICSSRGLMDSMLIVDHPQTWWDSLINYNSNYRYFFNQVQEFAAVHGNIFARTKQGIFLSADTGHSWVAVNSGLHIDTMKYVLLTGQILKVPESDSVAFIRANDSNVFIATVHGEFLTFVDADATWAKARDRLPADWFAVKQTNLWYCEGGYNGVVGSFAVCGNDLYAGVNTGFRNGTIFRSNNNNSGWTEIDSGLTAYNIYALLSANSTLIAGSGIGLCLSADGGTNWLKIKSDLPFDEAVTCLASKGHYVMAGTSNQTCSGKKALFVSADNGVNWSETAGDVADFSDIRIFSLLGNDTYVFTATSHGVFRSADSGKSWTAVMDSLPVTFGVSNGLAIRWDTHYACEMPVYSLAVSGTTIVGGSYSGVCRSIDNGAHWTWALDSSGIPITNNFYGDVGVYVTAIAVQGANLYAGTSFDIEYDFSATSGKGAGIYLSTDTGVTWSAIDAGLPKDASVKSLLVNGSQIFASVERNGVFVSIDTGRSWAPFNSGLPDNVSVTSLLVNESVIDKGLSKRKGAAADPQSTLFAGTNNRGVWRMPLSNAHILGKPGKLGVDQQPKIRIASMRSRCRVSYTIASSCFVTLSLYSISGKLLSTIINKAQSPGNYTAAISHNVASGFYVLKFKAGNYEVTDKLLLQ